MYHREVTAILEEWRLLLFVILENQSNDSDDHHAELKKSFPCNHNCHPLSSERGQRLCITPG